MLNVPAARPAVEAAWAGIQPDYSAVTDVAGASSVLTALAAAALDILVYRRLVSDPDGIHLVSGEPGSYLRYGGASDMTTGHAVNLSHILADNAAEALWFAGITGSRPPARSLRVHVIVTADDNVVGAGYVRRLDLDPRSRCRVDWYGPFNAECFGDIATGFALFVTHMVANVFPGDDGTETFSESVEYVV